MNTPNAPDLAAEIAGLRARLAEAEETLEAIRTGAVDALVVSGPQGDQVFTLQGAETPYRLLLESIYEGAATLSRDGTVLYCNHRFAELAGSPADQIVGSCLCDRFVPAQQPAVRALVAGALHVGARGEFTFRAAEGPGLPVLLSLRQIQKDSETIAVVATDLSERKAYEERLKQLNQELEARVCRRTAELEAIFDTAPIGLAITEDPDGRHIRGNPAIEQALGLGRGDELSWGAPQPPPYRCLADGREVPPDQLPMQRAARGETVTGSLLEILRPDGTSVTLLTNAVPLRDEQGRPCGSVSALMDVSERKRAEKALRESEAKYHHLFESIQEMVTVYQVERDDHGQIVERRLLEANPAFLRAAGVSSVEAIRGKTSSEFFGAAWSEIHRPAVQEAMDTGKAQALEAHHPESGHHYITTIVPLDANTYLGTGRDITGLKEAEAQVSRSQRMLSELVERAPFGIYIVDSQFRIAQMNLGSQSGAFRNVRPVIGRDFAEAMRILWPEPVAAEILAHFRHTLQTGESYYSPRFINPRHDIEIVESYEWELHRMTLPDGQFGVVCYYFDSTKLRQAEAALRESEERLRLAQASANMGVWDWDPRTGKAVFTPENERLYGLPPGAVMSYQHFRERVHPDDVARIETERDAAIARHEPFDLEFRVVHPSGECRWLSARGGAVFGAAGEVIRVFGVNVDITERKRMEEALRESESRYRLLFDRNPDGVFAVDTAGRFVLANPACEAISGYSAAELLQKNFRELCAPDQLARTLEYFERGLRESKSLQLETALLRKDGRRVEVWIAGEPLTVDHKQVVHCSAKDITGLKQAERDLFQANERMQALMHALPVGVSFSDDPTCQRITGNPAVLAQFEVTAADNLSASAPDTSAPGRQVHFLRDGQPITDAELPLQRAVAENREIPPMELEVVLPSGRRWFAQASGAPVRDQQGDVVGGVAVTVDITAHKRAEEALRESEARAKVGEAVQVERQRLQQVLDMLPAYVILLAPDYHVPVANRFFEERFGKAEGRRCHEYLFQRVTPCENCETYKVLKTNAPHRWEWTGPDGRNYDIHDFPFTDVNGSPLIMEVGLDVTERKQAEMELAKHREHLEELVQQRTAELRATNSELSRFNEAMIGRELRMVELKQEINVLCAQLHQSPRYPSQADYEPQPPSV